MVASLKLASISDEVAKVCPQYIHNLYQATLAAIIISHRNSLKVIHVPTGSGKTWIQGLIAKSYLELGKSVVIVEPNELLRTQTL